MTIARVIDYETSDAPDQNPDAEIIEMGRADVNIEGRYVENQWRSFCLPRGPISPVARSVHHIEDAELQDAPQARELWDTLFEGLTAADYLVAHKAEFEAHFHAGQGQRWIDTYKVARVVWPDAPKHTNQALRYWLGLPCDAQLAFPPHRALPDAYVTAHLFIRLLDHKTPEEMATISEYPALLKSVNFGKYYGSGMTFEQCARDDPGYMEWVRDISNMSADTKFSARYWLQKQRERAA